MFRTIRAALAISAGVAVLVGSATTAHAANEPSVVRLQTETGGLCLTVNNGALRNGVRVGMTTCADGLDNQLFELAPIGSAMFEVRAKHSGKCLQDDGTGVPWQWLCNEGSRERWRVILVEVSKELYQLRPMHRPTDCLSIFYPIEGIGALITPCEGGDPYSKWRIQPVVR
ncbi:RICIN domain-containing protein [Streptomyces albireticuli]|uniref:RICIN domain-containing protein n=1 Tax=Streptomyces albireticuli TaxID=1940 RepID=UPI0036BE0787